MTNIPTEAREWHPIELAIIRHIDRYGLTTPDAACAAGIRGMTSVDVAEQRLKALVRRGDLIRKPLAVGMKQFVLSQRSLTKLGNASANAQAKPDSMRATITRYAFLAFCCLQGTARLKLTREDLQQRFADLYRPARADHYYLTHEYTTPCLGFLRIDCGNVGRWDRIIAKASDDLRTHLSIPLVRTLLDAQAFELTIITPLPQKAGHIQAAMEERRGALPVPVRCVAMPELINLIRPSPD